MILPKSPGSGSKTIQGTSKVYKIIWQKVMGLSWCLERPAFVREAELTWFTGQVCAK